jgi:hypothetical protein
VNKALGVGGLECWFLLHTSWQMALCDQGTLLCISWQMRLCGVFFLGSFLATCYVVFFLGFIVYLCGEIIVASLCIKLRTLLCISWHFVVLWCTAVLVC